MVLDTRKGVNEVIRKRRCSSGHTFETAEKYTHRGFVWIRHRPDIVGHVMRVLKQGYSLRQTADEVGISVRTVARIRDEPKGK